VRSPPASRFRPATGSSTAASSRRALEAPDTSPSVGADPRRDVRPLVRGLPEPSLPVDRPGQSALALIGGRRSVPRNGVLSVASMVGFITLFGIATRNGFCSSRTISISPRRDTDPRGGRASRLGRTVGARLMTALTAGLALIPLLIHAVSRQRNPEPDGPGHSGGLISSTFLNMIVVPVLFARWGGVRPDSGGCRPTAE